MAQKNITVKITKPKTTKKFSLKDVKIKPNRSYWDGYKSCIKYTITNNSSKNLIKVKIYYKGTLNDEVSGYINLKTSIPRGKSKTFTSKFGWFDKLDEVKMKVVSAS